jgi:hypothetical protein
MSGVVVAWYVLKTNAALIAEVPAARIFSGPIPLNTALPAIGLTQVSGAERLTVRMTETSRHRTDRVQDRKSVV